MTSYRTFTATSQPSQVWAAMSATAPDSPDTILIANNDLINPIYFSTSRSVSVNASDAIQVPPLGTLSFSAKNNLWCVSQSNAQAFLISDGSGWTPSPAQIAQQNALAGVSILANPVLLFDAAFTLLPGAGTPVVMTPLKPITVNGQAAAFCGYLSYDILISLSTVNNNETHPFATIQLDFYENVTDLSPVDSVVWTVAAGFTGGHITNGKGPLRGQYVVATMTAISSGAFNQNVNTFRLMGTSRTVIRDDWRDQNQPTLTTLAGKQMTGDAQANNLGVNQLLVVNAGANNTKFTNLFAGDVFFFCQVSGLTTNQLHVQISGIDGTAAAVLDQFIGGSVTQIAQKITLGRSLYSVSYSNNSGVAATILGSLTALEP